MTSILTPRQAEELTEKSPWTRHKAIIAYLSANNLSNSATALRTELGLAEDVFDAATAKKYEGLIEKKWTSVIMDLESRNNALQSELDNATPLSLAKRNTDPTAWLPAPRPRYSLESHQNTINCIAFHPVYSSIASGSDDCTIKIWDWELGELERTIKSHTRPVLDVDFGGPRGGILLASCSSDLTIKLWDPSDDYKNIRTLPGHDHSVSAIRFMPSGASGAAMSGNLLVSASRDMTLKIWDVSTGFCLKTIRGHTAWIRDVYPSLDGRYLLSTGDDSTVRLWDLSVTNPENRLTMIGHDHYVECCALAPPSSYPFFSRLAGLKKPPAASSTAEFMASGSRDKTIKLWDARGTLLKTLIGHDNWVRALVFHPGGRYLLSVSDDKTLRCWDLEQDGKCVKTIGDVHERFVTCLRWAPGVVMDAPAEADGQSNGTPRKKTEAAPAVRIRCVIATGSVDMKLRIFAN
ncbi:hypothetical protein PgNI_11214 [Pyricularia grisea]|uniref:Nuclear distribution protein PAC1 n=1 Tax=Pyricularia grisea TaxID=148305 RepID=A0A6P8API7_PYRGI|nr:hypothetical protein PgNI_11214 [Pyricularia grisea]TLD03947.1 hypothetical protein PgNI_11214 [Pyricularia grisea]